MSKEIVNSIEQIARDKNLKKEVLIEALELALVSASKKVYGESHNIKVKLDEDNGEFRIFAQKKVVDVVSNPSLEIEIKEAKKIKKEVDFGDTVDVELPANKYLGRIAAQTAKQVVLQKIHDAEANNVYEEFKDKEGSILSGVVLKYDGKDIIVDVGNVEVFLPHNEQIFKENLKSRDRIKVYCLKVRKDSREYRGHQIIVSRTHPSLLRKLLELEIPEIASGVIEIKSVSREPGYRAKVAVFSKDKNVDAVGACIGVNSNRIQSISKEISGEKIDVIEWNEDIKTFIATSLSPAEILEIKIDKDERKANIIVSDEQLLLAIGKKGQNARLTAKLTGFKIDIKSKTRMVEDKQKAIEILTESFKSIKGIDEKVIDKLVDAGFVTPSIISGAKITDIVDNAGINERVAEKLLVSANEIINEKKDQSDE